MAFTDTENKGIEKAVEAFLKVVDEDAYGCFWGELPTPKQSTRFCFWPQARKVKPQGVLRHAKAQFAIRRVAGY